MKLSGSRIIIEVLKEQGVDTIFGYPGGANLPLYDALIDAPIRHILTVHEQGAAHAADGYARASGRVGVCIATSGPGATNLVTGLATAFMDSVPVVAITGQVATPFLGKDAFQGVDVTGITMPITKHNYLIQSAEELADSVREAFFIAREGRPGPVLIDVPRDILLAEIDFHSSETPIPDNLSIRNNLSFTKLASNLDTAFALLKSCEKPVMIVGGGVRAAEADQEVLAFARKCNLPVACTLMGLGVLPSKSSQFLGMTGMHGKILANKTVAAADLIIAVGTRFSDRVTGDRSRYVDGKKIIHIDIDAGEVGRNITADVELIGDMHSILTQGLQHPAALTPPAYSHWWQQIEQWRLADNDVDPKTISADALYPRWIMNHVSDATEKLPVIWVTDVGQHQMWAAQYLEQHHCRSWLTSGGMGTMGFGLPAAMGAQVACPEKRSILFCGDGGFKMTAMELYTIVNHQMPLICIILDNHALGMVKQLQYVFCEQRYNSVHLSPFNFSGFGEICGVRSFKTTNQPEFVAAFSRALLHPGPTLIVAEIPTDAMVDPMVQPGQSIDRFVQFK